MAQGPGQRDGKMGATRGLRLQPEMPSRVKGCVHQDKITTEPQKEAILEWRLGRGEMFERFISDERLSSKIYKDHLKLNNKNQTAI